MAAGGAASRWLKNFEAANIAMTTMKTTAPRTRLRELEPDGLLLVFAGGRTSDSRGICCLGSGGTGESGTASGEVSLTGTAG